MNKLEFLNPVGLKSDNFSTVRLGTKWADRTFPEDQRTVELVDGEGRSHGTAEVTDCWVGKLAELPAIAIECEHDPVCRTWSGVAQVLAGIYTDATINFETVVTVLRLRYTGSILQIARPTLQA